jgi:diazepam-binding inhibitor (GABA receptor modulating acyl-CoA-binding protein)
MDIADLAMLLESMDNGSISVDEFDSACDKVKELTNLDEDQRLQLYGLFKQSTVGNVNTSRPIMLDMVGIAKWDAWKQFEGMPQVSISVCLL